ncbi:Mur ligase domain-containing protein [Kitasatospora sp. LaBMicrA B282]|uniref:Mur ligase domain-containing protein n=1 Tax=Kitasatospora sp. LaBMicrA B282 TaxID=3420949 RepID=UPI003D0B6064
MEHHPHYYDGPGRLSAPHLVGIDEIGMPALAQLLLQRGARVTGSAAAESEITAELTKAGARITYGFDRASVRADRSAVLWSKGGIAQESELARAEEMRLPILHHAQALALLIDEAPTSIMVTGSHSVASAAALLVAALDHRNPSYLLNDAPLGRKHGHHSGGGLLIAAAEDEDQVGAVPALRPTVMVISNVAAAPPRHRSQEAALDELEAAARRSSTVVLPTFDPGACALATRLTERSGPRVIRVGESQDADVRVMGITWDGTHSKVTVQDTDGSWDTIMVAAPGRHTAQAAALVFAAGRVLGARGEDLARGLSSNFIGVERSLTPQHRQAGITVVDSLAAHPDEVEHDLRAARMLTEGSVIAVLEPSGWARTVALGAEIGRRLSPADEVVLLPVHAPDSRPHPDGGAGSAAIARAVISSGLGAEHVHVLDEEQADTDAEQLIASLAAPGDLVLITGTGRAVRLTRRLLFHLGAPTSPIPKDL